MESCFGREGYRRSPPTLNEGYWNLPAPEEIDALRRRRDAFHDQWQEWYRSARKFRALYEHLHLEVIEDQTGWVGRLWDATNDHLFTSPIGRTQKQGSCSSRGRA